jgi:hypothetical protein
MLDGAKAAETSSVAIASAMGVQRGGTVGIELGFYRGIASAWAARGHMYVARTCVILPFSFACIGLASGCCMRTLMI